MSEGLEQLFDSIIRSENSKKNFYGELHFKFQDGKIVHIKKIESIKPDDGGKE